MAEQRLEKVVVEVEYATWPSLTRDDVIYGILESLANVIPDRDGDEGAELVGARDVTASATQETRDG